MEIGFNCGHSAEVFLKAKPENKVHSFSIIRDNLRHGKRYLDYNYPERLKITLGESQHVVPAFANKNKDIKFDLIFIDGAHWEPIPKQDLENCKNPIIVCNEEHRFITAEQLRQIQVEPGAILLEPCSQNTAPAIAVSALRSISEGEDQLLLILPSDHLITNKKNFLDPNHYLTSCKSLRKNLYKFVQFHKSCNTLFDCMLIKKIMNLIDLKIFF